MREAPRTQRWDGAVAGWRPVRKGVNDNVICSLTGSVRRGAMTRLLYLANRANKDANGDPFSFSRRNTRQAPRAARLVLGIRLEEYAWSGDPSRERLPACRTAILNRQGL
jgi:hypothetical protein